MNVTERAQMTSNRILHMVDRDILRSKIKSTTDFQLLNQASPLSLKSCHCLKGTSVEESVLWFPIFSVHVSNRITSASAPRIAGRALNYGTWNLSLNFSLVLSQLHSFGDLYFPKPGLPWYKISSSMSSNLLFSHYLISTIKFILKAFIFL